MWCTRCRFLDFAQAGAGARNARHQCTNRNAERCSSFLIGEVFNRHEMEGLALLFRQTEESIAHLLQTHGMFLRGWQGLLGLYGGLIVPSCQRSPLSDAVDVSVMHNREQPRTQVTATAEALLLLVCPDQGIMDQIFRVIRVAHQGARVAPKRCELTNDIEWAFFPFHN